MTTRVPVERGSSEVIRRVFTHGRRDASRDVTVERGTPGGAWRACGASRASERACVRVDERTRGARELARRGTSEGWFERVYEDFREPPRGFDGAVALTLSCGVHSRCCRV